MFWMGRKKEDGFMVRALGSKSSGAATLESQRFAVEVILIPVAELRIGSPSQLPLLESDAALGL